MGNRRKTFFNQIYSHLEQRIRQSTVVRFRIDVLWTAATRAQGPIFAVIYPICGPIYATALQFTLDIVPRDHIVRSRLFNGRFQRVLQNHFQVRFEGNRRDANRQFNYEDNC